MSGKKEKGVFRGNSKKEMRGSLNHIVIAVLALCAWSGVSLLVGLPVRIDIAFCCFSFLALLYGHL